jgi:translocation and assembly module TamA
MKKRLRIILFCLFAVSFGVSGSAVLAHPSVSISGVSKNDNLYQWLDDTILDRFNAHGVTEDGVYTGIEAETKKALRAKGYYDADVSFVEGKKPVLDIKTGKPYTISEINIEGIDGVTMRQLKTGERLDATSVLQAQRLLGEDIEADFCPYRLELSHEVILDHQARSGSVTFIVDYDSEARFGQTRFEGAPDIKGKYLERFIRYEQGDCWSYNKIEKTKTALLETGLLSVARDVLPDSPDADGTVDVVFDLKERASRTVRLGASYYTDEGPGILAEWVHRNFFGAGERVSSRLKANFLEQSLKNDFSKPYFWGENRTLNISNRLGRVDSDAYVEDSLSASINLENKFHSYLKGSLGFAVEATSITDKNTDDETTFGLFSTPVRLTYDNRKNPLDPHDGWHIQARGEPFFDALGEADPFVKTSLTASTYLDLKKEDEGDLVLALRGRLGGLLGSDTAGTPASKRFYAGGGGSIRGFGYQEAGPEVNGEPAGGRSVVETSVELRFKVTENMGGAVFVDGGGAYDAAFPDFKEGYYIGAGAGFRYYTAFGPLRVDLAVPVNKRDQADSAYQFYISIGQAF